jgi:prephenate dehydratase
VLTQTHRPRVAFQGERGAFSEEAAVKLMGEQIELVPRLTFAALFSSVDDRVADYLVAPVENSIAGVVRASVNLLEQSSLVVTDEVAIPIAQHLIACPGVSFAELEAVQSHPVALAQCSRFLAENPQLSQVTADDTAGSVAEIINRNDRKVAAIAGRRAAEIYGGAILKENIQDSAQNFTRFVLLSPSDLHTNTNLSFEKEPEK